jgi:RimJ/RimL family protein N-acetyltransferase
MEFGLASDEDIIAVIKHPEIWGRVSSDKTVSVENWAIDRTGLYLGGYVDGEVIAIMVFHEVEDEVSQCHIHVLPEKRKDYAREFAIGAFEWYWNFSDYRRIKAEIPTLYPDVIRFAEKVGFQEVGVVPKRFVKQGNAYDMCVLSLERVK